MGGTIQPTYVFLYVEPVGKSYRAMQGLQKHQCVPVFVVQPLEHHFEPYNLRVLVKSQAPCAMGNLSRRVRYPGLQLQWRGKPLRELIKCTILHFPLSPDRVVELYH